MNSDTDQRELLLLITRYLERTPCTAATQALKHELDKYQLLPKRRTWEGVEVPFTYSDAVSLYDFVKPESLPNLMELMLTQNSKKNVQQSPISLIASSQLLPTNVLQRSKFPERPCHSLRVFGESHLFGSRCPSTTWPATRYRTCASSAKVFGHLAPVFCVAFDRRGEIVFTGSDDHLIKAWHLSTGRLLATFRGHHSEISDIAISADNSLMASGSCDKSVRVWDLCTTANIVVLKGHTGTVTVVAFSPMYCADGDSKTPPHYFCYLASGGADGVICLWRWRSNDKSFKDKPIKFTERSRANARILSMSFSEGGFYLVAGSSDSVVRVYSLAVQFDKIAELEGHAEPVDSLQFANTGIRFATASCDGSARIFHYERQHWRQLVINCSQTLTKETNTTSRVQVCMLRWTCDDKFLVVSVSDKSLKVFDSHDGQLVRVLKGHKNQAFCISCSNFNPYLVVSGGYDGLIIVWDIRTGEKLFTYQNTAGANFEECGAIHALTLSPDDSMSLAAADSYGHVLLFSFSQFRQHYQSLPEQMFFHTDYRAITHNANDMPLDQNGKPPHELPPPWLIDSEGAPYPSEFQRLVPGREKLTGAENVPEIIVDDEGYHEVTDRSVADAAAGRPPQNLPVAWSATRPLCRVLQQAEIANIISRASALYDAEYFDYDEQSRRKPPKKSTDNLLAENHRLRSWDHRLHGDPSGSSCLQDGATIPAVNRLVARALYDTDSEGDESGTRSTTDNDRTRRAAARHNHRPAFDEDDSDEERRDNRHRTRQRVVVHDEETNDVPGPSSSSARQLRSSRRLQSVSRDSSRGRADEEMEDDSRSQDPRSFDEASRASSDMSVSEAVKRIASGTSTNTRHRTLPRVAVNGVDAFDDESEAASDSDSLSSNENNSDDSDWHPSIPVSNGHRREHRAHRPQETSRSTRQQPPHSSNSNSRASSSRREKKREERKSSRRSGARNKKSESPAPSRYALRDHSRPSTSRVPEAPALTRGASSSTVIASPSCNGQNGGVSTRRQQNSDPPIASDRPSERSQRYKRYLTSKRHGPSPTLGPDNEASSSVPDSEIFERANAKSSSASAATSSKANASAAAAAATAANGDLERFQPPQWMSQTSSTVRFPFVPQIGDEVVYFWRGHRLYVDAVQNTGTYTIRRGEFNSLPFNALSDFLNEEEICRVEDVSFELLPDSGTRVIAVQLLVLRTEPSSEPVTLSFKFHDLANVVDFVILRQWYDRSLQRQWSVGDKFRSLIDGQWYSGVIVGRQPAGPGCSFRVFRVLWDLEDDEDAVSPWDIEPLPKKAVSSSEASSSASPGGELAAYAPRQNEWPPFGDRDTTSQRIISCLDQIMHMAVAEPFVVPVDFTAYPLYPCIIAYPVDLSLVRERMVSGYYRRTESIKWDVRFISKNASLFNEVDSTIVRDAQTVVDALLAVIDDADCVDASSKFPRHHNTRKRAREQQEDEEEDEEDGDDDDDDDNVSDNDGHGNSRKNGYRPPPAKRAARATSSAPKPPSWMTLCQEVLSRLWLASAGEAFRDPVDLQKYPDYTKVVKKPIDLAMIRRRLREGHYKRPVAFLDDVRLLFDNSRLYNTNDRSPIYAMTTQLIDIFDGALSEFGELLDDEDDEAETNKFAASSSRRSGGVTNGNSTSKKKAAADEDASKRYRTRLTTGTIHYSNVVELDAALDEAVAAATARRPASSSQGNNQVNGGRYHYRRLAQVGGGSGSNGDDAGTASLRRPATRHLS